MKKSTSLVFWLLLGLICGPSRGVFAQADKAPPASEAPAAGYERVVEIVTLKNAPPARMQQTLKAIGQKWNLFPSLQIYIFQDESAHANLLFVRGYAAEVTLAVQVTGTLDKLFPPAEEGTILSPLPLKYVRAPAMKKKLLELSRTTGLGWQPGQLLIFPPGPSGSLFFNGSAAAAKKAGELKTELDQSYYGSFGDLCGRFWRAFRSDVGDNVITVSTYVISALLLLLLHFLLIKIPGIGRVYERWFTLIWTKLLDGIKGKDFALEVIREITETAVISSEQYSRAEIKSGRKTKADITPAGKKERARRIARQLLAYRGFNPDDPQVKRVVDDIIEAEVYDLTRFNDKSG